MWVNNKTQRKLALEKKKQNKFQNLWKEIRTKLCPSEVDGRYYCGRNREKKFAIAALENQKKYGGLRWGVRILEIDIYGYERPEHSAI